MLYFSVQMIQLGLLAGLGLLQFLGEPLVGVLEGRLGVVVDDGAIRGLDASVDLENVSQVSYLESAAHLPLPTCSMPSRDLQGYRRHG